LLRGAALAFAAAAIVITRMGLRGETEQDRLPTSLEYAETHAPPVVVGSIGFMAIRGAVGFFVFMLAFTLRQESEPKWVYGVAIFVYGAGAFVGNLVAPVLRKRFSDQQLIAIAIALPTLPTLFGMLGVSRALLLVIATAIGVSTTLGRHGFDSLLQDRASAALRGRAAARYETRFQLVWAIGALIATPISLPPEASMAVLAALYIPALSVFLRASTAAKAFEADVSLDVVGRAGARLATAEQSLSTESYAVAVIDAAAAIDLARLSDADLSRLQECVDLNRLRLAALEHRETVTHAEAQEAVALARLLLTSIRSPSPE